MASKPASPRQDASLADVDWIFFDVGGTLLQSSPSPAEIFRRVLASRGRLVDRKAIAEALQSPDRVVTMIRPLARGREAEFFRSVNARLVEHLGFHEDEVDLDAIHETFERDVVWRPYPDVVAALKALRSSGIRTGVISNYSHRLGDILKKAGLAGLLDSVTYSFEVGAEKPDPRIFRAAVARAGVVPERAVHVGDSFDADYLGARRVGLHAILLCREGGTSSPCPSIRSLADLPGLVRAARSRK